MWAKRRKPGSFGSVWPAILLAETRPRPDGPTSQPVQSQIVFACIDARCSYALPRFFTAEQFSNRGCEKWCCNEGVTWSTSQLRRNCRGACARRRPPFVLALATAVQPEAARRRSLHSEADSQYRRNPVPALETDAAIFPRNDPACCHRQDGTGTLPSGVSHRNAFIREELSEVPEVVSPRAPCKTRQSNPEMHAARSNHSEGASRNSRNSLPYGAVRNASLDPKTRHSLCKRFPKFPKFSCQADRTKNVTFHPEIHPRH